MNRRSLFVGAVIILAVASMAGLGTATQGVAAANATIQPAELAIRQPHYIAERVRVDSGGEGVTYIAHGARLDIRLQTVNQSRVVDYGVREETGELTYSDDWERYVLVAEADGSYHLWWTVKQPVIRTVTRNNSTVTTSVIKTIRYEATIRVTKTGMVHAANGTLEKYRTYYNNWQDWVQSLEQIFGASVNVEAKTEDALQLLRLANNPLYLFSGTITSILILLFLRPGGWFLLGLDRLRELCTTHSSRSDLKERESLDKDRADIEEQLDRLDREETARTKARQDISELIDDDLEAEAFREAWGDTVYEAVKSYTAVHSDEHLAHDRLQMMALAGWHASASLEDGECVVRVHAPVDDADETTPGVPLADIDNGPLLPGIDALLPYLSVTEDFRAFDPREHDFDRETLETRVEEPTDIDDMADEVQNQNFYFDNEEDYAKCQLDLWLDVADSPLTNEDGSLNTVRDRLSRWFSVSSRLRDEEGMPLAHIHAQRAGLALDLHNPGEAAQETLKRSQEGQYV